MRRSRLAAAVLAGLVVVAATVAGSRPGDAAPVPEAPGCPMFPADSYWHADVSGLPVHPSSATYVSSIGSTASLKADFGAGLWDGGPIGIPYTSVPGTQPRVPVTFQYASESDPGPYPIPPDAPIEGGADSTGDRHVLVVDRDACRLYETFDSHRQADGSWRAGSGAVFDMRSNALRPAGWTSADAAGMAILPGLVRYDEVASGAIDHAIRVTVRATDHRYVWPARHRAGTANPSLPPMGLWLRLKASVDISGYPAHDQVILRALKKHGMIVADNGSSWFMSGVPDERWNNDVLAQLRNIRGSDFEAVDVTSIIVDPNSGAVRSSAGGASTITATGLSFGAVRNQSFTKRVATFTSTTASTFTASIAWGDGATSTGTVVKITGGYAVKGTHTYAAAGTYPVTVTIRDAAGTTATATSTAKVRRG